MSAPDTNLEKQARRHFGPIWGIAAVVALVGIGIFVVPALTDEASEEAGTITQADQTEMSQ